MNNKVLMADLFIQLEGAGVSEEAMQQQPLTEIKSELLKRIAGGHSVTRPDNTHERTFLKAGPISFE